MNMIIKPQANEISISTANDVSQARLVRLVNTTTGNVVITIGNSTVNTNFTMLANTVEIIEKDATHTVGGTNIRAVKIAYKA